MTKTQKHPRRLAGWMYLWIIPALLLVMSSGAACKSTAPAVASETSVASGSEAPFIHITDIHFNPFYDPSLFSQLVNAEAAQWKDIFKTSAITGFGTLNKDETNFPLLFSTLEKAALCRPRFVIFTGDFICHKFQERFGQQNQQSQEGVELFIKKTVEFVMLSFREHFGRAPVFFCLGNNDAYEGDYLIAPEGAFLKDTASLASTLCLVSPEERKAFGASYAAGGYYSCPTPLPSSDRCRITALNANFFSTKFKTSFTAYDPAQKQLEWLENELESARRNSEKIWLLLHIPPGLDVFDTDEDQKDVFFWRDDCLTPFMKLMRAYHDVIRAGFAGHTHMDEFRLLNRDDAGNSPAMFIRIAPAVSPQFGNNPAFTRMAYHLPRRELLDYDSHFTNLTQPSPQWKVNYNFRALYRQPAITAGAYSAIIGLLSTDETIRDAYRKNFNVEAGASISDADWKSYWCGVSHWTGAAFDACMR